jgi:hypothetical protein
VEFLQAVAEGVSRAVNGEVFPEGKVRLEVSPGEPEDLAEGSREGQEALAEEVRWSTGKKQATTLGQLEFSWV